MLKHILSIFVASGLVGLSAIAATSNWVQAAQPEKSNLRNSSEMICRGVIQNRVDYTATFSVPNTTFTSISFRPRTSTRTLSATLRYEGRDYLGRGIWRGAEGSAAQADITLVRLSSNTSLQQGEQISVSYDGQWGRATCQ